MGIGIIATIAGWVIAALLGEITLSCAYRIASANWKALPRWSDRAPDAGWLLPELTGSGCLAALAFAGVHPVLLAPAAGILFALAVVPLANIMRIAAGQGEAKYAGRRIWRRLSLLAYTAREFLREDFRALAGRRKGNRAPAPAASGRAPVRATPGVPPWKRAVPGIPPVASDPALGPVPAPSEVSAALAAGSVMVPATWAAVAAEVADHEPESDEEHVEHMDGEVAGVLTVAEAAMSRAETLGDDAGLDPAYVSAQFELADAYADLAAFAAQVMKRYHDTYDDLREAADGKLLPAKRGWFGDGGGTPPPGFWVGGGRAVGPA